MKKRNRLGSMLAPEQDYVFRDWIDWIDASSAGLEWHVGMVHAFIDGSGKDHQHDIVCFGGVAATSRAIGVFDEAWRILLLRTGLRDTGLSMKQALDARQDLSPTIKAQPIPDRIEVLRPFAEAIRDHIQLAFAVAVNVSEYRAMPVAAKDVLGSKPDYLAFGSAILACFQLVNPATDRMNIVSDDDDQIAWQCYRFYRRMRSSNKDFRARVSSLTFADDTMHVPLQAADMVASLARNAAGQLFFNDRNDYEPLFRIIATERSDHRGNMSEIYYFGAEKMKLMSDRFAKMRQMFPNVTVDPWVS